MRPETSRTDQPEPRYCPLCRGGRVMRLVRVDRIRGAGRTLCPACVGVRGGDTNELIPIRTYPSRIDTPRGGAA